jgi:peptidyl-prolyl cis-trans isomerase SurA
VTIKTSLRARVLLPLAVAILLTALAAAVPAAAQSLFRPVAQVNDRVITEWQVQQRARFLDLFRTPGNTRLIAIDRLIEEQLQLQEGDAAGIAPSEEALVAGMTEFAGRVNLTMEEFIDAIGQGGVAPETFRDFVAAGIVWRDLVRARFGPDARPTDQQINTRLLEVGAEGGTRVLLSEIILPAGDPQTAAASRARAEEIARITSEEEFAAAARLFSAAPTRFRGGELDWRPLNVVPENVRGAVAALSPGRATRPIESGPTVGVFFLRDREEVRAAPPGDVAVEYALLTLPTAEQAARVAGTAQRCDDLYGAALRLPADALRRETQPVGQLPAGVREAVAGLDPDEVTLLPGTTSTLVMLCARRPNTGEPVNLVPVADALALEALGVRATRLLAELRARATIVRFE